VRALVALPLASDPNALIRWDYVTGQWDDIQAALITHILLTLYTVAIGLVIAAALAALALRYGWATGPITGFTGFLYTIPSVALFGLLTPYTGYSKTTALIALVGYSLLILFTNIVAGFRAVPHAVLDAADGMGMTARKRLLSVELPLAMPYIITGIRIATVTTIGIITVASIIGQGGLGNLILDGLRRTYWSPMVVGAVLSVALALVLDLAIFLIGRRLTPWARTRRWAR
jgi:osmoprotectant transport system permease protein